MMRQPPDPGNVRRSLPAVPLLLLVLCATASAQIKIIVHSQEAAAKSAERFARSAFIDKDYAKAHALLAPETRKSVSVEKMAESIKKMHPAAMPAEVKAIEYETQPGQRAMNIYLKGSAGSEMFFYRFYMVGDATSGYEVAGLFRGSGPYPSKAKKPL
jgi:hypothetical protein